MEYLHIKTLYIEVTHACNQNCRHCYLDGGIQNAIAEMSTEQIKKILREFKQQDGRYVILTGGEPIMRSDLFEILDCIEELELPFSFASNSLGMTQVRLEKLASYRSLNLYFTSILGVNAEKHKRIAKRDGYEKVIKALSFFEKKGVPTYVQVTLANDFLEDIDEIAKTLMQYQNCIVKFTPIGTLGIKSEEEIKENSSLLVPRSKFEAFHSKIVKLQQEYPNRIEDCNIQTYEQIAQSIAAYENEELYSMCNGFLAVRPNGDLSFSCNMDNPYIFGKAYDSIRIPIDETIYHYIERLRRAEKQTLEEAEDSIIEFDVTVDKYIKTL